MAKIGASTNKSPIFLNKVLTIFWELIKKDKVYITDLTSKLSCQPKDITNIITKLNLIENFYLNIEKTKDGK
ncbi:MAG: hypothetical protein HQK79_22950 [Desulfobacterales bacterium]|nr:hypothetical protein [Desulfobacterales bacterium]